jgi:hypothetical protein
MRRPRSAVTASLSVALATMVGVTGAVVCSGSRALAEDAADAPTASMSVNTATKTFVHRKDYDELQDKKFLQEHMDAKGQVRPDLEQKGLEHIREMKTAPSIGAKVSSVPAAAPTSIPKN